MANSGTTAQIRALYIKDCLDLGSIKRIESDMVHDYYLSADWSKEFYLLQAARGFIAVGYTTPSGQDLVLPQFQFSYCLLDFDQIHISSKLKKSLRKLADWRLRINHDLSGVLQKLNEYHPNSWINDSYRSLIQDLHADGPLVIRDPIENTEVFFQLCSIELYDPEHQLVAGELGYVLGGTYTALTGFCERRKNVSFGKVQILALAKTLEKCGFQFMNLGQPPTDQLMQYKAEIGGIVFSRSDFLCRWKQAIKAPPPNISRMISFDSSIQDLFLDN